MDEFSFFNARREDIDEIVDHASTTSAARTRTPTTPGGGPRPATRRCAGTSRTPTAAACATRSSCTGRAGIADARGDPAASSATRSTSRRRSSRSPGRRCPSSWAACAQIPLHGASIAPTFADPAEPPAPRACSTSSRWATAACGPRVGRSPPTTSRVSPFEDDEWGLYHLDEDFSECHDLAAEHPDQLRELIDAWWVEAGQHGVLPLDDRIDRAVRPRAPAGTPHARTEYVYYPPIAHVPADAAPPLGGRDWLITAEVERARRRRRGRALRPGQPQRRPQLLREGRRAALRLQRARHPLPGDGALPLDPGRHELGRPLRADRAGRHAHLVGRRRGPHGDRRYRRSSACSGRPASTSGRDRCRPSSTTTWRRSPSPGRSSG